MTGAFQVDCQLLVMANTDRFTEPGAVTINIANMAARTTPIVLPTGAFDASAQSQESATVPSGTTILSLR
jgi:hypothetical protein